MAGDSNYPNVALLLHGDGANNSTTFTDTSSNPKTVTAVGAAKISTAQSKFGGSSIYLDGTADSLVIGNSADLNFGAGNGTIEAWVRPSALAISNGGMICCDNNGSMRLSLSGGNFKATLYGSGFISAQGSATVVADTWYHVALSLDASNLMLFVDGALAASTSRAGKTIYPVSGFSIGKYGTAASFFYGGYIDDFRVTKGVALYTGSFTPPGAHLDYAAQIMGTVLDSSSAGAARTLRAYRRDTGALVGSTTSDGSTGAYTLNCAAATEVTLVCLDDSGGALENDLVSRVIPA